MTEYESSGFEPPAPVAIVTSRNPDNGKLRTDVQMLLDTGADVSLVADVADRERQSDEELSCQTYLLSGLVLTSQGSGKSTA